jgi:hypothetical protein
MMSRRQLKVSLAGVQLTLPGFHLLGKLLVAGAFIERPFEHPQVRAGGPCCGESFRKPSTCLCPAASTLTAQIT